MALRFGYFDSEIIGIDDEGMPVFDRAETSDLFALLFAGLISDGVLAQPQNCFQVLGTGSGMKVEIQPGFGMVKGHFAYDDEKAELNVEPAPQKYGRIDRVVMRCNYLERAVEIVIKTGTEAANPIPPELERPHAGDYFELCLANIRLSAGQRNITQSSITDTRADSSVCGYITQLIDHLDTEVFFDQLNSFYDDFVARSNISYEQFKAMAQTAYNDLVKRMNASYERLDALGQQKYDEFNGRIDSLEELSDKRYSEFDRGISDYIVSLKQKGESDLAQITEQLLYFRNTNEAEFTAWFERMKELLSSVEVGSLMVMLEKITARLDDTREMISTGLAAAKIYTSEGGYIITETGIPVLVETGIMLLVSDGDYIIDDTNMPVLVDWPICQCGS